jgi:hypothetical protein
VKSKSFQSTTPLSLLIFLSHSVFCLNIIQLVIAVMELCGGELADLSSLELLKRDDLQFQVVDESEYDEDDDDEAIEIEIEIDDDDDDNYLQ